MADTSGLSGIVGGLIGSGQSLPTVNIGALLNTIQSAGQYQQQIINALPQEIQQQLQQYIQSTNSAGSTYQSNVTNQGNNLLASMSSIYGPNSAAANAAMNAAKTQIYSTVPGTQDAIRSALAATGGLARGNAATALAKPYIQAAGQYGQTASNIASTQANQQQNATAQALQIVNTMDDNMFTQMFGMSKQQAQTILTTSSQALQQQLAQLINQSNTQTNQTLGVEGVAANNAYQNAVTRNTQQGQIWNGVAGLGLQGIQSGLGMLSPGAGMTGLPAGADVSSDAYMANAAAMAAEMGM